MMVTNPELKRFGWLEFSLHRLIAMPIVLAVIIFVASRYNNPARNISGIAEFIFLLLMGMWGGNKAAASLTDEINENTWDWQRLSSLAPWTLTLGKLIGSTSYCWYGGLMALLCYTAASMTFMPQHYLFCNLLLLVTAAFLCHATALFCSLQMIQSRTAFRSKLYTIGPHIIGIAIGSIAVLCLHSANPFLMDHGSVVVWFETVYDSTGFSACFAIIFLLWIVAGCYWQMRTQLRMRTGPWLWTAFSIFMMTYIAGFGAAEGVRQIQTFFTALTLLYIMAFTESWSGVSYRRLEARLGERNWPDFVGLLPRWMVSFLLASLVMLWIILEYLDNVGIVMGLTCILCFTARDIALLHYFRLNPYSRRATVTTLFYLGVLYVLIPMLLGALHRSDLAALFLITRNGSEGIHYPSLSLFSGAAQAALCVFLAAARWRKYWRQ